ncbi:carbohydrate ABC transporter permease [Saccharomonospora piscinae]|uniref:Sugar ABC transporter permease n=1 Tax=Saccharomonospora piscinae TaxID=687388 RepID=A0A1V9AC81_SACPI|nr:sugar ABC transporter permease [Saccharomonospora piscinae]OQO94739.1 sugar ABC transporter permease [Saccharomonospora piscinae]TLW94555.1 sugar ABC transporter permease [Saccharomonospora piscinae]
MRTKSRTPASQGRTAALLLSPTAAVLALVIGYPLLAALRESLHRSGDEIDESGFVVTGERFVGADNFTAALTGERFWNAFGNTTLFTVTTVTAEVVIGVAMALVMHRAMRGRGFIRAAILVPWAIPTAVAALLWRWIFQADGVANAVLGTDLLWTADGWPAQLAVIVADTWKTAPFVGLLVLAGLQLIPNDVYEAARLDGATGWQQFRSVTLPLVKPALLVAVLFRLLDALRMFDLPFVLVGAQKASVETLSMLAWDEANQVRYGPAAAYAVLLFCYIAVVAFVFVKLLGADLLGERRSRRTPEVPA